MFSVVIKFIRYILKPITENNGFSYIGILEHLNTYNHLIVNLDMPQRIMWNLVLVPCLLYF